MGKHLLILLVISLIGIIWIKEITVGLHYLIQGYIYLSKNLGRFIVGGYVVTILRQALLLMLFPFLVAGVPATLYWIVKRRLMPFFQETVYAVWFIILTALAFYK